MLNIPVNNFSVMLGQSHHFLGITSTFRGVNVSAQGHNMAEVGIEPQTSRSGVRDSTTRPPRSPQIKDENGVIMVRVFYVNYNVNLS